MDAEQNQDITEAIAGAPYEVRLLILEAMVGAPKVHFLKVFKAYNDGLWSPANVLALTSGELGVEEVGRLSGARKVATWTAKIPKLSTLIASLEPALTSIPLNPVMFPINRNTAGVPHVKVDLVNDLICVSSNGADPFFVGQNFSGGILQNHEHLKKCHRVCMAPPNFNLAEHGYECQDDCGSNYLDRPEDFSGDRLEFCNWCMGTRFALLRDLEQVFIIIPGLPRAQRTDHHLICRYGHASTVRQAIQDAAQGDPFNQFLGGGGLVVEPAPDLEIRTRPASVISTIERFGAGGPVSFDGDGITMYEVSASDLGSHARGFMRTVAHTFAKTRVRWSNLTMGYDPPAFPEQPLLCGGCVEFRFLSYSLDP